MSFRLSDEAIDTINELAAETGLPRSAAVELMARWMKRSMRKAIEWARTGAVDPDHKADHNDAGDGGGARVQ